jgi:hypothetical protein
MTTSILRSLTSNFFRVNLTGTAIPFSKPYKEGKHILAQHNNTSSDNAYRASRSLIPKGYDNELSALRTAYNAVRAFYTQSTVPFGQQANGDATKGERLLVAKLIVDGSFMNEIARLQGELDRAREAFALALNSTVHAISQDPDCLGYSFDWNDYPSPDEVRRSFVYQLEGPMPIADSRNLVGMPVSTDWLSAIETQMESAAKRQVAFAQQTIAKELADYLAVMATNLTKLTEYHATPMADRTGNTPPLRESMITNLQEAIKKARTYAVPDTDAGSKLIALIDQIEDSLNPDRLNTDTLKGSPYIARTVASKASSLAEAIEDTDWAY